MRLLQILMLPLVLLGGGLVYWLVGSWVIFSDLQVGWLYLECWWYTHGPYLLRWK